MINAGNEINEWLDNVSSFIGQRRVERSTLPRPRRNRERERARREARQLFREYYAELATSTLQ